jgi:hypothetical protein
MNQTTIESGYVSKDPSAFAKKRLEDTITNGRAEGARMLQKVQEDAPQDAVVRASAFRFEPRDGVVLDGQKTPSGYSVQLRYGENGSVRTLHKHAFGQLSDRAGVPGAYLSGLATSPRVWERDLAVRILNDHMHEGHGGDRLLVRTVRGEVRGLLSDRFRRLESLPLINAFASSAMSLGAIPTSAVCTDTRVALKVVLPTIFEPVPGEYMCIGGEWFNSDYGAGKYGMRGFLLRLVCLNGMVGEDAFSQIHLGGRLSEAIEYSDKTLRLDTAVTESATKDHVRALLEPKKIMQGLDLIRQANERKIDWKSVRGKLAKVLLKSEMKAVEDAFEGQDVVNLPAGQTEWRLSNAISWVANATEDADRKIDLERFAGGMFSAPSSEKAPS